MSYGHVFNHAVQLTELNTQLIKCLLQKLKQTSEIVQRLRKLLYTDRFVLVFNDGDPSFATRRLHAIVSLMKIYHQQLNEIGSLCTSHSNLADAIDVGCFCPESEDEDSEFSNGDSSLEAFAKALAFEGTDYNSEAEGVIQTSGTACLD